MQELDAATIDPKKLAQDMEAKIMEVHSFVATDEFQALLSELMALPFESRHRFVEQVVINEAEHLKRGLKVPPGIKIQRSVFADGRPTLFCVAKDLKYPGNKVTITYDEDLDGNFET